MLWASVLPLQTPEGTPRSAGTETLRRLSAEFEAAQKATFEQARNVKPGPDRASSARVGYDARPFARRALDLAGEARKDAVTVDALVGSSGTPGRPPSTPRRSGRSDSDSCGVT